MIKTSQKSNLFCNFPAKKLGSNYVIGYRKKTKAYIKILRHGFLALFLYFNLKKQAAFYVHWCL